MFQAIATATSTSWMYIEMLFGLVILTLAIELVTKPKALSNAIEMSANILGGKLGDAIRSIELPTPVYMAYRLGLFTTVPALVDRARRATATARTQLVKIATPTAQPQVNL